MLILLLFGLILIKIVIGNDSDEIVTNYVRCATTKGNNYMLFYIMYVYNYHNNLIGPIVLEIYRDWSPRGINILIISIE